MWGRKDSIPILYSKWARILKFSMPQRISKPILTDMPTCMPWKYPQQMRGQVPLFHNFHSRTGFTGLFLVRSLSTSHHTYQLLFFSSHFDQMPAEVAQLSALQSGIRGHQPSEVWGGGIGIGIGNSDMTIAISDCRNKCRWRGFPMPRPLPIGQKVLTMPFLSGLQTRAFGQRQLFHGLLEWSCSFFSQFWLMVRRLEPEPAATFLFGNYVV